MFDSRGDRDLGVAFLMHPGSQSLSRGEAKDSALLSSCDADLLEPPERLQGSPASSSVWREDTWLVSRPFRNIRPSSRDDRGVSCVSSSCRGSVGFLTRYDEELMEPLVQCQVSQVSMRVARGSASWLSSHGRGLGPRDALKKDSRGLCRGAAGNPRVPRLLPGTLGNFPGILGFLCGLAVKNPPANAKDTGDVVSVPGSGRSPGEGNGNLLQYSCLENPMAEEPGWVQSMELQESDTTERLNHHHHRRACISSCSGLVKLCQASWTRERWVGHFHQIQERQSQAGARAVEVYLSGTVAVLVLLHLFAPSTLYHKSQLKT